MTRFKKGGSSPEVYGIDVDEHRNRVEVHGDEGLRDLILELLQAHACSSDKDRLMFRVRGLEQSVGLRRTTESTLEYLSLEEQVRYLTRRVEVRYLTRRVEELRRLKL